jgi:ABC-2 type transport system permease protein
MLGNLVFLLMAPLSAFELFGAYVLAGVLRGLLIGLVLYAFGWLITPLPIHSLAAVLGMTLLAGGGLAVLGLICGIVAEKFDHMAAFQNFFIVPMSFLSGVFYSIHSLPPFWRAASHLNPFFYMIDGFRRGFVGASDVSPWTSLAVVTTALLLVCGLSVHLLRIGYKIRH